MRQSRSAEFYRRVYEEKEYSKEATAESHPFAQALLQFVQGYSLTDAKCVEIGSGRGAFQDVVADYTGVDYSSSVARYYHKPFVNAACEELPFHDNCFDAAWSYAVLEHVDKPEEALREIRRVLKPDGLLLLAPAWQCRPWAAEGYPVRPYSDFGLWGKVVKASIPIRDSVVFRSLYVFPRRLVRLIHYASFHRRGPIPFRYRRLCANFEVFWMSDSDAQNSMDPFDCLLWFDALGDECLNRPSLWSKFFFRTGPLVLRVRKKN